MIAAGLDGLHAVQPSLPRAWTLRRLKADFGGKMLFNGAIDSHHVLIDGTPESVRRKTREVLADHDARRRLRGRRQPRLHPGGDAGGKRAGDVRRRRRNGRRPDDRGRRCCTIPAITSRRRWRKRSSLRRRTRTSSAAWPAKLAEIAALPVHKEKARLWQKLNDLESERPMVWINEICWHEMDVDGELTLRTEHPWARDQERDLRRTLYQWRHLPGDMIVSDFLACPLAIHSTDFGIIEDVDVVQDRRGQRHRLAAFQDPDPRLRRPGEDQDAGGHAQRGGHRVPLPGDVRASTTASCRSRKSGQTHIWFTPWDYLIRWWGIEEAMIDLIERPELVHAGVERMVDAWMVELDQFVAQNLLVAGLQQHADRLGRLRLHRASCPATTSIRPTSGRTTCGAARTPRSSPRSRRGCTGSSP